MSKRITVRKLCILVIAVLVMSLAPTLRAAKAQAAAGTSVELVGTVDAINGSIITVNGVTVEIGKAQIKGTLEVGQTIKVEGTLSAAGKLTASEIKVARATLNAGDVEITGVVDAVNDTTVTIGGVTIDISKAEVKGTVVVGSAIKVHVSKDNIGELVAHEVEAADDTVKTNDDVQIVGTVQQDDNGNLTVNGNVIRVHNENETATPENETEIHAGDVVKVHFGHDDKGGLVPHEVEVENDVVELPHQEGELEVRGTVQSVGQGTIVINGVTISTENAEIKDQVKAGVNVKIHLTLSNGQMVAREVEIETEHKAEANGKHQNKGSGKSGSDDNNKGSEDNHSGSDDSGHSGSGSSGSSGSGSDSGGSGGSGSGGDSGGHSGGGDN